MASPTTILINGDASSSRSASAQSSPAQPPLDRSSSPDQRLDLQTSRNDENAMFSNDSESDVDAEGTEDDDYADQPLTASNDAMVVDAPTPSSTGSSSSSRKRKVNRRDDSYYMRMNPDVYGLRRSGRAATRPAIVESSDEDNDSDSDVINPRAKRRRTNGRKRTESVQPTPIAQSDDSEEEDEEFHTNVRHKLSKRQKKARQEKVDALTEPSQAYQRFSGRSKATANYNEASDFDDEDDLIEAVEYADYDGAMYEVGPKVDEIVNYRLVDGASLSQEDISKDHFEYLVKMQHTAHMHAEWITAGELRQLNVRKLDNYWNKYIIPAINMEVYGNPDDKEIAQLKANRYLEALDRWQEIERVISTRPGVEGTTDYFVKWKDLTYEKCTWETAETVGSLSQDAIDNYLNRSQKQPTSDRNLSNAYANPRNHRMISTQPWYIKGGTLRSFQNRGLNYLAHNWAHQKNVILADEMGLGKTVQTVAFCNWLIHDRKQGGPMLIIVPLSTMPAWQDTFAFWAPDVNVVVYSGNATSRKLIQDYELLHNGDARKIKFNVLLTTYEMILHESNFLSQLKWQFMAVDEAHRLKNRESQLYRKLISFSCPNKLLITGTPMQNSIEELRALLDFLNPGLVTLPDDFDLDNSEEGAKILAQFKEDIRPYILRRIKSEVETDLPPKTEKILRVELSAIQNEAYQNVVFKNYAALAAPDGTKHSLMNVMMEMKKVANHPFLLPNIEARYIHDNMTKQERLHTMVTSSGKMMLLDKLIPKLKADGHRVLVFTQLVKMLDILSEYMQMKGYKHQRLDGTVPSQARRQSIDSFNAPGSEDFAFLLSTRAGGLGINLMTADAVIIFDSDWNPHLDVQAMARAHRIGQTKPVIVFRFVSEGTVEEDILERARNKLVLEFLLIQSGAADKEKDQALKKFSDVTGEPTSASEIQEILKRRSKKMFEATDNQKKLEELDIDNVIANAEEHETQEASAIRSSDGGFDFMKAMITSVKFEGGWDTIIPAEDLRKLEEEEQKQKDEEFLRKAQEESKPRKRRAPGVLEDDTTSQRAARKRAKRNVAALAAAQNDDSDPAASESDSEDDSHKDPKRPLEQKEWRNLIRACERYGSFLDGEVQPLILKEARLNGRDIDVLLNAYEEITSKCRAAIRDHEEKVMADGKAPSTKKEKKAILLELHGVKRINCETFLERAEDMSMIRNVVSNTADISKFRVPEATKPAHYTCEWGAREDGMLVVGMARYGFGGWVSIQKDEELGMTEKFFLEEHRAENKKQRAEDATIKSPGAVHLVRRANYMLAILRDKTSNGNNTAARRALENHHRNNKKAAKDRAPPLKSRHSNGADSPSVNGSRKIKITDRPRKESHSGVQPSIERPDSRSGDHANGHRRKTTDDGDRDSKRPRLSNDDTPDRRHRSEDRRDRPRKHDDRERVRKDTRRENPPTPRNDFDSRRQSSTQERRDPKWRRSIERSMDRRGDRDRSRSPRRDDRYRDRREHDDRHRNGHSESRHDPRRDTRRIRDDDRRNHDRPTHRDRRDSYGRVDRPDDRHSHRDRYQDSPKQHSSEHRSHHNQSTKSDRPSSDSKARGHFDQNKNLCYAIRDGLQFLRKAPEGTPKSEQGAPLKAALVDMLNFLRKTSSNEANELELWSWVAYNYYTKSKDSASVGAKLRQMAINAKDATKADNTPSQTTTTTTTTTT